MGSYNSIKLEKLYKTAAAFCGVYVVFSILSYILSGTLFSALAGDGFKASHPEMMISGKRKVMLCLTVLVGAPFIGYIISCTGWAFSAKRCRRTLKAAPLLWIFGFIAEHALALLISHLSGAEYASERWLIQRTEYITFFFGILLVGALVLVCTAAALGIDEDRHVKHLKYK